MAILTVSSSVELQAAYAELASGGGGTILLEQGVEPYDITLKGDADSTDAVSIMSADSNNPVELTSIHLNVVENVTISNISIDTSDIPGSETDTALKVMFSHNVVIEDSTFTGRADGFYDDSVPDDEKADDFAVIDYSSDVTFEANTVSNYFHGIGIFDSQGVDIIGNDISNLQGDGIRMSSVQDIDIIDNHLHDFLGSTRIDNHDDMIQIWSTGADTVTSDVTISGNFLDSADGTATQTIFIGNEMDQIDPDHVYENIVITDNLIYNGHVNGIAINGASGVTVTDNTLIYNSDSYIHPTMEDYYAGTGVTSEPAISLTFVENAVVTGNITAGVSSTWDANAADGNQIMEFTDTTADNYVGNHFVNAVSGGVADIYDLQLLGTSDWIGTGASISQPLTQTEEGVAAVMMKTVAADDMWQVGLDASFSVDEQGYLDEGSYDFVWTFEDGTVLEGMQVIMIADGAGMQSVTLDVMQDGEVVDSIERTIVLDEKELATFDFTQGLDDLSSYGTALDNVDGDNLVSQDGVAGYVIGGDATFALDRGNDQIHNLDTFGMSIDMAALDPDEGGVFLSLHNVMEFSLSEDGAVTVELTTTEGDYTLTTDAGLFQDGDIHTLGVGFDGVNGVLEIIYDGESVASTQAYGTTAPETSFDLVLGGTFTESMDALIQGFSINADPEFVGVTVEKEDTDLVEVDPVEETEEVEEQDVQEDTETEEEFVFVDLDEDTTFEDPLPEDLEPEVEEVILAEDQYVTSIFEDREESDAETEETVEEDIAVEDDGEPSGIAAFLEAIFEFFSGLFGDGDSDENDEALEDFIDNYSSDESIGQTELSDIIPVTGALSEDMAVRDQETWEDCSYHIDSDWLL